MNPASSKLLVLTPLLLPREHTTPLFFLGDWALPLDYQLKKDDHILPYHWKNRGKFYSDYTYLLQLQERLLPTLASQLNRIHSTSFSIRYWRLLVGPWLGYFTQILFDRWEHLSQIAATAPDSVALVCSPSQLLEIPQDTAELLIHSEKDLWNQVLFETLVPYFPMKTSSISLSLPQKEKKKRGRVGVWSIKHLVFLFSHFFIKDSEYFFISTQFPLLSLIKIQVSLGQFPRLWSTSFLPLPDIKHEEAQREWRLDLAPSIPFEKALFDLIPRLIPTLYLEGYSSTRKMINSLPWPKKPPVIFTCAAQCQNDLFKFWAAEKTECGSKLVIGQHGGGYGQQSVCFHEDHEKEIYDAYLSWGWKDPSSSKIKPGPILKQLGKPQQGKWNPNGHLISVQHCTPRYSYWLYTSAFSSLWLEYFRFQCDFISALSPKVQSRTVLRLYSHDFGWQVSKRFAALFPTLKQDSGSKLQQLLSNSRLVVCTYNGTTHLETLAQNIPTLIVWDPTYEELRPQAIPYYDMLKKAGIFHTNAKEAADFIETHWEDISSWWHTDETQSARQYYCQEFCKRTEDDLACLMEAFRTL